MAFSRTEFPSEIRYKRKWSYLFYHGFCRDDLFLVILLNKTHSLIITIVVATLSLVNSKYLQINSVLRDWSPAGTTSICNA